MKSKILNVFKKERKDTFRDRRTVIAALAYAFFGPGLLIVVLNFLATQAADETPTVLAVEGAEHAPELVAYIEGEGVDIIPAAAGSTPREKIGDARVLLVIDEDFRVDLAKGKQSRVDIFVDRTNSGNSSRANRVREFVAGFGGYLTDARLLALGVSPALARPMEIQSFDLSTAGATAKTISFMLIYFFVLAPFFSSLSVSIDTTAGERERKSLQSLLAQPVAPIDLIVGKWMIATLFGIVGTSVAIFGGLYAMGFASLEVLGIRLHLGFNAQLAMLGSLLPLAFMVAALQILVSLSAKSYKEANTYLQLLSFTPVMVGLTVSLSGRDIEGPLSYLPIISHLQNTQAALIEGGLDTGLAVTSGAISVGVGILCLILAAKRLKSETILSAA